jgi:hypothetical protein
VTRAGRARVARTVSLAALVLAALVLTATGTAAPATGAPRFTSALPARLVVDSGAKVVLPLAARSSLGRVQIGSLGLPPGASLKADPNSSAAIFRWTAPDAGSYAVTFTAHAKRFARIGVARTLLLIVHPVPIDLDGVDNIWYWAYVDAPVNARAWPAATAPKRAELGTKTPEGTANLVLLTKRFTRPDGSVWYQARLPILPNNATGWVPADALSAPRRVTTHLVVDRQAFTATLYRRGQQIFQTEVGVGTPDAPTPAGEFYVRDLLLDFGSPFYGPAAFGTSGRSPTLTEWPDGGHIGIHGTNQPELIPGRISHGCIRMTNQAILRLVPLMPIGTPVSIR